MDIDPHKIGSIKLDLEVYGKPRILIYDNENKLIKIFTPKVGSEYALFNQIAIAWDKAKRIKEQ